MVDCPPESLALEDNVTPMGMTCDVCGTIEFVLQDGLYYCSLCQTQSQDTRHFEDQGFIPGGGITVKHAVLKDRKHQKRIRYKDEHLTLSSWEIHNLVIKNMADRLIELGFPETLKPKVFQIWSFYLLKREALFVRNFQEKPNTKPQVSLTEPKMNLFAMHGHIPRVRLPPKRRERDESDKVVETDEFTSVSQTKKKKSMAKRKAVEAEYRLQTEGLSTEDFASAATMIQQNKLNEIDAHNKSIPHTLTNAAKKTRAVLKLLGHTPLDFNPDVDRQIKPSGFHRASGLLKVERFTLKGIFILLFVALRQLGCKVVFSDLMRMLQDGTLYVQSLKLLLEDEEFLQINGNSSQFITSLYRFDNATACSADIHDFVQYVGLKHFIYPPFEEVLPKFIDDMRLPKELECFIIQMNRMFTVEDNMQDLRSIANLWIPMMEIWVLATIGVAMKMLFGLDDVTEKYQSHFAQTVNKVYLKNLKEEKESLSDEDKDYALLFVLKDWFKEMEIRDHIVSHEIFNPQMYQPDQALNLTALNKITERFCGSKILRKGIVSRAKNKAVTMLGNLQKDLNIPESERHLRTEENHDQGIPQVEDYLTIPFPKQSVMEEYMKRGPNVAYPDHRHSKMNMSFESYRIDYIFHPERYVDLLTSAGYDVKIFSGSANMYCGQIPKGRKTLVTFKPHKCYDDFVGKESECSDSLRRLITLFNDIAIGADRIGGNRPLFHMLMGTIGDLNCRRCLGGFVPLNNYDAILKSRMETSIDIPKTKYSWVGKVKASIPCADLPFPLN